MAIEVPVKKRGDIYIQSNEFSYLPFSILLNSQVDLNYDRKYVYNNKGVMLKINNKF